MLKLRNAENALANFFAQGVLRLGPKLGPILWQFSPDFRFEAERIETFLASLPRDTAAALEIARHHDRRVRHGTWLAIDRPRPLRYAIEIRHDSFIDPRFVALLRKYRVALVCADTVEWPLLMDVTSDFVYCRLHGSEQLYASGYDAKAIAAWSRRVVAWAAGDEAPDGGHASERPAPKRARRDVFVYFDNDAKVRAPFDAQALTAAAVAKRLRAAGGTVRPRQR